MNEAFERRESAILGPGKSRGKSLVDDVVTRRSTLALGGEEMKDMSKVRKNI
jgi:hypothetical protein